MASPVPGNASAAPAPQAAGNSLFLATQNKVGSVLELSPPQRLGRRVPAGLKQASHREPVPSCPDQAKRQKMLLGPSGCPQSCPAPHPGASIPGRGVLLPQRDGGSPSLTGNPAENEAGWNGLPQLPGGSDSLHLPWKSGGTLSPGCHLRCKDL